MNDVASLRDTIVPKSDQLNADDLLAGPITVKITGVHRGDTAEQPISIDIDGGHQPYKPCKTMRRVLIAAWGDDGREWPGRSMTLYCDPEIKFGGVKVGGIRISHMSNITSRMALMLTTTRSKRSEYIVEPLACFDSAPHIQAIEDAADMVALQKAFNDAQAAARAAKDSAALAKFVKAKDARKLVLSSLSDGGTDGGPPTKTYAEVAGALESAKTRDDFDLGCDLIQYVADLQQREELGAIVKRRLAEFKEGNK